MDCRTALETLDVRPIDGGRPVVGGALSGGSSPEDSAVRSAVEHVRCCPECTSIFERRTALDERLSRVLRDVPVPSGLKERLLFAVRQNVPNADSGRDALPQDAVSTASVPAGRSARRRRLETAVTTAVCLLVGLAVWYVSGSTVPQFTLQELEEQATWDLSGLPEFAGDFEPRLPTGWPPGHVQIVAAPKGGPLESHVHRIALYEFRYRSRGRSWQGVLLVTPKREVAPSPSATYFTTAAIEYLSSPRGRFATTVWGEGDYVYVCAVNGGADVMEALQRTLEQPPA